MMEMVSGSSCKERAEKNKNEAESRECTLKKKIRRKKNKKEKKETVKREK